MGGREARCARRRNEVEVSMYLPQPIMHPVYVPSPASQPAPGATACLAIESTFLYIFFLYCAVQFSKLGFVKRRPAARDSALLLPAIEPEEKKKKRNHKRSVSANAISRLPAPPCCAGAKCQFSFFFYASAGQGFSFIPHCTYEL